MGQLKTEQGQLGWRALVKAMFCQEQRGLTKKFRVFSSAYTHAAAMET